MVATALSYCTFHCLFTCLVSFLLLPSVPILSPSGPALLGHSSRRVHFERINTVPIKGQRAARRSIRKHHSLSRTLLRYGRRRLPRQVLGLGCGSCVCLFIYYKRWTACTCVMLATVISFCFRLGFRQLAEWKLSVTFKSNSTKFTRTVCLSVMDCCICQLCQYRKDFLSFLTESYADLKANLFFPVTNSSVIYSYSNDWTWQWEVSLISLHICETDSNDLFLGCACQGFFKMLACRIWWPL